MSLYVMFRMVLVLLVLGVGSAWSHFEVSPFVLKLQAGKGQLSGWLEVKPNQNTRPVAVELTVLQRQLDLDGVENNDSLPSADLTVYPSEMIIYPGEKKKVQVVWSGANPPETDRAYTILASEVPVELNVREASDKVEVGMNTLVRYRLVVALETRKPGKLSVVSVQKNSEGKVEVLVENKGAGRIPMDGFYLLIAGVKYPNVTGMANAIMPGQRRRFVVPISQVPSAAEIRFGAVEGLLK